MIEITPEILECYKTEFSCQYAKLAEKYTDYLFIGEEDCSDKKLLDLVTTNALLDSLCLLDFNIEIDEDTLLNTSCNYENSEIKNILQEVEESTIVSNVNNTNTYTLNNFFEEYYKYLFTEEVTGVEDFIFRFYNNQTILDLIYAVDPVVGFSFIINNVTVYQSNFNIEKFELKIEIDNCNKYITIKVNDASSNNLFTHTIYYSDFITSSISNINEITKVELLEASKLQSTVVNNYSINYYLNCFSQQDFHILIETIKNKLEGCSC